MIATWTEIKDLPEYGGEIGSITTKYEGEIIGTNSSFWYGETITVACTDGKIRTVTANKVTIRLK